MKLIPLKQFICDSCRQVIENPGDGWFEWLSIEKDGRFYSKDWRISHHTQKCTRYSKSPNVADGHLDWYTGENMMAEILSFLDPRIPLDESDVSSEILPENMPDFIEVVRRFTIPHYEEARQYFSEAHEDGLFAGCNEVWPYTQDTLKMIIAKYQDK